jgi:hypothetical protein
MASATRPAQALTHGLELNVLNNASVLRSGNVPRLVDMTPFKSPCAACADSNVKGEVKALTASESRDRQVSPFMMASLSAALTDWCFFHGILQHCEHIGVNLLAVVVNCMQWHHAAPAGNIEGAIGPQPRYG